MKLAALYRGPLSSCNYACRYCPFSKRRETEIQLNRDRAALSRFRTWLEGHVQHRWKVFFTPWGEALIRSWYREAIADLSQQPHIESLTVQTNLSCGLTWLAQCRPDRVSLWATYHPTETSADAFLQKVHTVCDLGIRICVGTVGVPEFLSTIAEMKRRLPPEVYLWVNAQQPRRRSYTSEELHGFQAIDPQFLLMARRRPSFGKSCSTGEYSFTVDGNGDMRRCHFVDEIIGNCYKPDWESALQPRTCPNRFCDCFLGRSHFLSDELSPFFGSTALERLPKHPERFDSVLPPHPQQMDLSVCTKDSSF
jgi:MoaA/NifB/PqqE/SkfB family radical SAM enzyme